MFLKKTSKPDLFKKERRKAFNEEYYKLGKQMAKAEGKMKAQQVLKHKSGIEGTLAAFSKGAFETAKKGPSKQDKQFMGSVLGNFADFIGEGPSINSPRRKHKYHKR